MKVDKDGVAVWVWVGVVSVEWRYHVAWELLEAGKGPRKGFYHLKQLSPVPSAPLFL